MSYGSSANESVGGGLPTFQVSNPSKSDQRKGFSHAKEFEYSFKKNSVETIKPGHSVNVPRLPVQTHDAFADIDQKINWFKSENSQLELSKIKSNNHLAYLRVEENLPGLDASRVDKKGSTSLAGARDQSEISTANLLSEIGPLSEVRYTSHQGSHKVDNYQTQNNLENYLTIPTAPKIRAHTESGLAQSTNSVLEATSSNLYQKYDNENVFSGQQFNQPSDHQSYSKGFDFKSDQPNKSNQPDPEKTRLKALVEAQKSMIAEMQDQLKQERLKNSKYSVSSYTDPQPATVQRPVPNSQHDPKPSSSRPVVAEKPTSSTHSASRGFALVSQTSLDSMFQTYMTRQKDWQKIKSHMLGQSSPGGLEHYTTDSRHSSISNPTKQPLPPSATVYVSQEKQVPHVGMQPKIHVLQAKRKQSNQMRSRSNSASRLSIRSGTSVTVKRNKSNDFSKHRKEKSADPCVYTKHKHSKRTKKSVRGEERHQLEPETLALLTTALKKNKAKTKFFVEKLKALVAEVVGMPNNKTRGTSRSRSREKTVCERNNKAKTQKPDVITLESLSHAVSSQRSQGSGEKKRRRVR